jgi:hypothetical protein
MAKLIRKELSEEENAILWRMCRNITHSAESVKPNVTECVMQAIADAEKRGWDAAMSHKNTEANLADLTLCSSLKIGGESEAPTTVKSSLTHRA